MKMKKLQDMMKQAQQMQSRMEEEMREMRFEASSGGGVVTVVMDGSKKVHAVRIRPEAVDPDDVDMLPDLIVAALSEAGKQVDEALSAQLGGMAGGLGLFG